MHENGAKIIRVSSAVTGGFVATSILAIIVLGTLVTIHAADLDSRLTLVAKVIPLAWSVALYAFGLTIPSDIT